MIKQAIHANQPTTMAHQQATHAAMPVAGYPQDELTMELQNLEETDDEDISDEEPDEAQKQHEELPDACMHSTHGLGSSKTRWLYGWDVLALVGLLVGWLVG
jgi:hypothetical protein